MRKEEISLDGNLGKVKVNEAEAYCEEFSNWYDSIFEIPMNN